MHRPHALASDLLIDATVVSAVGGGDVVGKRNFAFRFTIASVHQIEHHWGQVPGSRIRSQVSRGHKSSWEGSSGFSFVKTLWDADTLCLSLSA